MRLLEPGIGEIVDRLSILNLKVLFGREKGLGTSHFEREQTGLLAKIRSRTLNGPWFQMALELAAINAALWHAEDDLRYLRLLPDERRAMWAGFGPNWHQEIADLAIRIQVLNDKRSDLVAAINKEAGDGDGAEKL